MSLPTFCGEKLNDSCSQKDQRSWEKHIKNMAILANLLFKTVMKVWVKKRITFNNEEVCTQIVDTFKIYVIYTLRFHMCLPGAKPSHLTQDGFVYNLSRNLFTISWYYLPDFLFQLVTDTIHIFFFWNLNLLSFEPQHVFRATGYPT